MTLSDEQFEEARAMAIDGLTRVNESFTRPDDDWMPVALLIKMGEVIDLTVIGMTYGDMWQQAIMRKQLATKITAERPQAVALVQMGWTVNLEPGEDPYIRPVNDPRRMEMLLVTLMDGTRREVTLAPVERDGVHPPTLGPWTEWARGPGEVTGTWIETISRALKASWS